MTRQISPPATNFFAYRTVVLGFFNLNIKARHEIREFLNANLQGRALIDTSCSIRHRLELKYFHLAQFLLNAHQAAHRPRNSENR